jgi:hypothetical protein
VLLPLLFFTGLMNTLDRTNLSFAALQMNAQLQISAKVQEQSLCSFKFVYLAPFLLVMHGRHNP